MDPHTAATTKLCSNLFWGTIRGFFSSNQALRPLSEMISPRRSAKHAVLSFTPTTLYMHERSRYRVRTGQMGWMTGLAQNDLSLCKGLLNNEFQIWCRHCSCDHMA
jgi:hypothetical protein